MPCLAKREEKPRVCQRWMNRGWKTEGRTGFYILCSSKGSTASRGGGGEHRDRKKIRWYFCLSFISNFLHVDRDPDCGSCSICSIKVKRSVYILPKSTEVSAKSKHPVGIAILTS